MEEQSDKLPKKITPEDKDRLIEEGMNYLREGGSGHDNSTLSPRPGRTSATSGGGFESLRTSKNLGLRDKIDPNDPATMPGELIIKKSQTTKPK